MENKTLIPKFVSTVAIALGCLDLVRGFMHTIMLEYAAANIAGLESTPPGIDHAGCHTRGLLSRRGRHQNQHCCLRRHRGRLGRAAHDDGLYGRLYCNLNRWHYFDPKMEKEKSGFVMTHIQQFFTWQLAELYS